MPKRICIQSTNVFRIVLSQLVLGVYTLYGIRSNVLSAHRAFSVVESPHRIQFSWVSIEYRSCGVCSTVKNTTQTQLNLLFYRNQFFFAHSKKIVFFCIFFFRFFVFLFRCGFRARIWLSLRCKLTLIVNVNRYLLVYKSINKNHIVNTRWRLVCWLFSLSC